MTIEIEYVELLKLAHEKIGSQSDKIADLEKGYEELRIAALHAVCKISGGQTKADLRDAYDKATEHLKALKDPS